MTAAANRFGIHVVLGLAFALGSAPARAHLDLTTPPPRLGGVEGGNQLKTGPCGQQSNARTDRVTVFEAGATITVEWNEYVDHDSYYRIAFDIDGDDSFPIRTNMDAVDRDSDDPEAAEPIGDVVLKYVYEAPDQGVYSTEVTLPDVECDNCTLQIIQFMYDKLGDGKNNEYYFQCADIELRRSGGAAGASSGGGGQGGAASSTGGSVGSAGSAASGGSNAATGGVPGSGASGASTGSAGSAGLSTAGSTASLHESDDGGGCMLARPDSEPSRALVASTLLAAVLLRRRQRPRIG